MTPEEMKEIRTRIKKGHGGYGNLIPDDKVVNDVMTFIRNVKNMKVTNEPNGTIWISFGDISIEFAENYKHLHVKEKKS